MRPPSHALDHEVCRESIRTFCGDDLAADTFDETQLICDPIQSGNKHPFIYDPRKNLWHPIHKQVLDAELIFNPSDSLTIHYYDGSDTLLMMSIGTRHPREIGEIFLLLDQPAEFFAAPPAEIQRQTLAELAGLYLPIPYGTEWRALNMFDPPADLPADLKIEITRNLLAKYDEHGQKDALSALDFARRWPQFIGGLPDATPLIRMGYSFRVCSAFNSSIDSLKRPPHDEDLYLMLVPHLEDISAFFLVEYLSFDATSCRQIRKALAEQTSFDPLSSLFREIPVDVPCSFVEQIKLAAQTSMQRDHLDYQVANLCRQSGQFHELGNRYRQASQALDQAASIAQHPAKHRPAPQCCPDADVSADAAEPLPSILTAAQFYLDVGHARYQSMLDPLPPDTLPIITRLKIRQGLHQLCRHQGLTQKDPFRGIDEDGFSAMTDILALTIKTRTTLRQGRKTIEKVELIHALNDRPIIFYNQLANRLP